MRNAFAQVASTFAIGLVVLAGCGGGGAGGGGTTVARDATGRVVHTAGGAAVSEEAHSRWQEGLRLFTQYEGQGWNEARCTEASEKFEEAADAQGGRFAEALYMAGVALDRCGQRAPALGFYNRALSANERFCKARVAVGISQSEAGSAGGTEAMATFQRAVRDDNQCTEGYVNLAIVQRRSGNPDQVRESLNNLRRALAIDAQYLPAFNEMAQLYLDQAAADPQRLGLAEVVCRQAQQINRDYAPIYNTWGLINVRQGNIIGALAKFERAYTLDNTMFEAFMNFGEITLGFRGYEDANRAFARAVELRPRDYDAHIGYGAALRGLRQIEQAKAQYEAAREIDGNRPEAYFNLALLSHDYMSGSVADLNHATELYNQFLGKAGANPRYATTVEEVRRRCPDIPPSTTGHRRRRGRQTCRPGRLQNIVRALDAMRMMAENTAAAARIQAAAAERERQQQQQQQQTPTPTPTPTPAPTPAPNPGRR